MGISRAGEGTVGETLALPSMRSTGLCRIKRGGSVLMPVLCQGDRGRDQRIPVVQGRILGQGQLARSPQW